jgi:arylamine N-acetyltransferase
LTAAIDFPPEARALLLELAALPYENLSKIVAFHTTGSPESAQDVSARWLDDHARSGLGGTCFSLTHWLKIRLDALGFSTAYLMADKPSTHTHREYNVHCGLLFEHGEAPYRRLYLLDPGYLIFEPLLLPAAGLSVTTFLSPNEIRVEDAPAAGTWRLFTGSRDPSGKTPLKPRFDFRKDPVTTAEFERHWEASHRWEMMGYPVLNRVRDGVQYYLQKNNLLVRTEHSSEMKKLDEKGVGAAAREIFGLPQGLVDQALGLLRKS